MKPTVLFVHSNSELYGADYILLLTVRALRELVTPIVALPGDGPLSEQLRAEGVEVILTRDSVLRRAHLSPAKLPRFAVDVAADVYALRRLIRARGIGLVFSNTSAVITGALAARAAGVPNVYHVHEIVLSPPWLARGLARFALTQSRAVIAVSGAVRAQLLRHGRPGDAEVTVIHNGLDPSRFDDVNGILDARQALGASPGDVLFGVIGRIHPWKGQDYFLKAAQHVAARCPNARFAIVGGTFAGYERLIGELEASIRSLNLEDRVRLLSHRTDVPQLMRALDVFVSPSVLPDPLPTVVLEAMCARRPVIATAHGGALEMVADGETGLLASPTDEHHLAEVMIALATDEEKRRRMGNAGRARLDARFSLARFESELQRYIAPLIASAERPPR